MDETRLSLNRPADVERAQIEGWRRSSPAEKIAVVTGLTQTVFDLALAGVRWISAAAA